MADLRHPFTRLLGLWRGIRRGIFFNYDRPATPNINLQVSISRHLQVGCTFEEHVVIRYGQKDHVFKSPATFCIQTTGCIAFDCRSSIGYIDGPELFDLAQ